jgi:16S rRNA (uracil1498-N3)-methyltransferase
MARRRFIVPTNLIRNDVATLPPEELHHVQNVLRLRSGDEVEILDGAGACYSGILELRDAQMLVCRLQRIASPAEPVQTMILAAALIKSDKFEWILQKGTELGVEEFIPLHTKFSEIRIPVGKLDSRRARWQRIVGEAAKQCRRLSIPRISPPTTFEDFLAQENRTDSTRLIFCEKAENRWTHTPCHSNRIVICIGPEGGWDAAEVRQAAQSGYAPFNLGPRVLRAETAAIAAVSILQFQIGPGLQPS